MSRRRHTPQPAAAPVAGPEGRWTIPLSAETEPGKIERALRERVKELNCLYAMSRLAECGPASLPDFLNGVVNTLPPSWQYPEITCARIVLDGRTYKTAGFKATRWRHSARILIHGEPDGEVSVFYREERPVAFEGPFLREECALLDAVAERIGTVAMRMAAEEELQETNRRLTVEQQALQETNTALRTVLARIEDEKREIHRDIHANVAKVIMPILHALAVEVPRSQRKYVDLLKASLENITSPFVNRLSRSYHALSPTEVRICDMIRGGLSTKEIARIRNVSPATINRHREHIRRKLGITNEAVNLTTHLQGTMQE